MLAIIARSGPPEAQNCPTILCDQRLERSSFPRWTQAQLSPP